MVDINPLPLPLPHEPPPKKSERSVDADAFHKEMHKRVEKVSETDQEQKKKRKRQEEAEEEDEPKELTQGPTTPPGLVTPFSMADEKKKVSPLQMGKGGAVSPLASAQPTKGTEAPPPSSAPLMGAAPSSDEMEDDSGFLEETAFLETTPTEEAPPPAAYPTSYASPEEATYTYPTSTPLPAEEEATPPPLYRPPERLPETQTAATPPQTNEQTPEPTQEKKKKKPVEAGPPASPAKPKKAAPAAERPLRSAPSTKAKPVAAPLVQGKVLDEKGFTAEEIAEMREKEGRAAEETGGFFEQFVEEKEKGLKKEIKPESPGEREGLEGVITPITPLPPSDYIEKEKKEEEEVAAMGLGGAPSGLELPIPPAEVSTVGVNNPYTNLHPEAMELFDRMVGTITVMTHSGITETVVTLDTPKFASSVFFGSQIIIQEYSSAPHAFNIQLNGSPEATALFRGNADELMAAFQYGNYSFRVNRLETGLLKEKPLIRRKGPPSGGKEDKRR